jgi:hypothetical protein
MSAFLPPIPIGPRLAYKRSASPLTTGTLWTVTGGILITEIYGIVRTVVQTQATTVGLSGKNDSLTAVTYDAATLDLNAAVAGSVIARPAAFASAMVLYANGTALGLNLQNTPIVLIPTTSAIIKVTYGAASTGVIDWYMQYMPLVSNTTVV